MFKRKKFEEEKEEAVKTKKVKKPFYKRKWFIGIVVLIVLSMIFGETDTEETTSSENNNNVSVETKSIEETTSEVEEPVEEEPKEIIPETTEERVKLAAEKAFGEKLQDVLIVGDNETIPVTRINVTALLSESWSGNATVKAFFIDATDFLEDIQDEEYESVFFQMQGNFVDQYGNESESNAIKLEITKTEVDKINFENFDWNKLPNLSETFEVHPALEFKG